MQDSQNGNIKKRPLTKKEIARLEEKAAMDAAIDALYDLAGYERPGGRRFPKPKTPGGF